MVEEANAVGVIASYDALLAQREDKNVLRFVTEKVFIKNLEHHFHKMTAASMTDKEEAAIEVDLGTQVAIYLFYATSNKCNNCDRALNAYDFYFSGKNVHGNALKTIIVDAPYKIQVRGIDAKATVVCSKCQSLNVFPRVPEAGGEDGGYHYIVGKYCYA
ncbi:hypothetical protein EIK77_002098 [Talaromyces pinophilus]|nr:hypothetical protein EIK77_002098 [Talaromyces pinophilus]PCG89497.1 Hypothetical protein PENO1_104290 [Penicillium occitanis (nom. inval.)]PCG89836.1 hypothetical protein PENOC_104770 [Penicillium occitanis (nom. inval.)]